MDPPAKKSGLLLRAEGMMETGDHYGAYEIFLGQISRARDDEKVRSIAVPGAAGFASNGQIELCVELAKAAVEKSGVAIAQEICESIKNNETEFKILKIVLELQQQGKVASTESDLLNIQKSFVKCSLAIKKFGLAESVLIKSGDVSGTANFLATITKSNVVPEKELNLIKIRLYLLLLSNGHHTTAKRVATDGTEGVGIPYFLHRSLEQKSVGLYDHLVAKLESFFQKDVVSRKAAERTRELYFGGMYSDAVNEAAALNAAMLNGSIVSTAPAAAPAPAPAPKVSAALDLD